MILSAHQLHYLPWLRYIHKIAVSDIFVILDNIQFNKNGWQNRNKIKAPQGAQVLTVPVLHKQAQMLSEVQTDAKQPWRRKHLKSLQAAYSKAPFYTRYIGFFEELYAREWTRLNDLNYEILQYGVKTLGIETRIVRSSDIAMRGEASGRLVALCEDFGAHTYLSGSFAVEEYLDRALFDKAGVKVGIQEFVCPEYSQLYHKAGFVPELSIVDLMFNCGPESLNVLLSGNPAGRTGS